MERLWEARHGREGRRLSEREMSESNPVGLRLVAPRDSFDSASLRSGWRFSLAVGTCGIINTERQWPKAKSMLSARSSAPSHGRLVGPRGENGSTTLVLFGLLPKTWC